MHANSFWAANLPLEEEIHSGASAEQRATFIRRKYRERKYRRVLEGLTDPEQLNKVQLFPTKLQKPQFLRKLVSARMGLTG